MRKLTGLLATVLLAALLAGCATGVSVTVTKPAEINMAGNRVIAVLDFRPPEKGGGISGKELVEWAISKVLGIDIPKKPSVEQKLADYTSELVVKTLLETGHFQMVSPQEVARAVQGRAGSGATATDIGKTVNAQAIITGELYLLETRDEEWISVRTITDATTGKEQKVEVPMVRRTATAGMTYQVINTQSGTVVASRSFEDSETDNIEKARSGSLPSAQALYEQIVRHFMPTIARQLAPYQVRERRPLMRDKTKDPRMDQADSLVKGRLYDDALEIFLAVWSENGNVAAGFNAAIAYEVTGRLDLAIEQMKSVARATADRKALREYERLLRVKQEQDRLMEQLK